MHERQRYEKQTDRLLQSWFSKTKNDEIAAVSAKRGPGAKCPGRPFGDFSDGAEKSLGPEAEIPLSPLPPQANDVASKRETLLPQPVILCTRKPCIENDARLFRDLQVVIPPRRRSWGRTCCSSAYRSWDRF